MPEPVQDEFLRAGIADYVNVRKAMQAFEDLVRSIAKGVVSEYLDAFRKITGLEDLAEANIRDDLVAEKGWHGLGVMIASPDTWGIRWGIKWVPDVATAQGRVELFMGVRLSALKKIDRLHGALRKVNSSEDFTLVTIRDWPSYEVQLTGPMPADTSPDAIRDRLNSLVGEFLRMIDEAGGLKENVT